MADEDSMLNSSSSSRNWFHQHVHAASLSSWDVNNTNPNWNPQNPNSSYSSCEEDISMSTTSASFSRLTVHPTGRLDGQGCVRTGNDLMEEDSADNHLWNHVLSAENLHNTQDVGDNLINAFSLRNLSEGRLFEPACSDYLKKLDNGWEISSFEKNFNGYSNSTFETERLTKASNSVNNWSIAPPDPEISSHFNPLSCFISLSPTADRYSIPTINQKLVGSYLPHSPKLENETCASGNSLQRSISSNGTGYLMGMDSTSVIDNSKFYGAVLDVSCNKGINFADLPHFNSNLSKPWMSKEAKPILKSLNLSDCKKQPLKASHTPTASRCNTLTSNRKGHALANEGKKKRYEENSDTALKKPKQESSTVSSAKAQVPKPEWREKITSLQQIVSPFGKTDAASVLFEAINHIKFLQDQVHLLSNPYMKTNTMKDPWGGMYRKVRGQIEVDLKSRGLCLVPVLSIPQVYRENIGPDYLTPAYRGSLYR
ncbi:Transcription factor bHLH111 [Heracleum sosnowskyi]|uniref:Transcription factor bHLH111 n=1 Tax=Heracleum sosnowskyi TaxID=360622 RepID=A0AAD8IU76_9APIA|nr:Transcription factor bHLH111 [Heracleum sosnowskyi]